MRRHGNSLNTSDKPRLAQFISMSPTPRDVTPAERKDAAAERVREEYAASPAQKKPCFGPSETLEAVESRFLGATLPAQ